MMSCVNKLGPLHLAASSNTLKEEKYESSLTTHISTATIAYLMQFL